MAEGSTALNPGKLCPDHESQSPWEPLLQLRLLSEQNQQGDSKFPPQTGCKAGNYKKGGACTSQLSPRGILWWPVEPELGRKETGTQKRTKKALGGGSGKGLAQDVGGVCWHKVGQGLCLCPPQGPTPFLGGFLIAI